jgi:hypothetical protein
MKKYDVYVVIQETKELELVCSGMLLPCVAWWSFRFFWLGGVELVVRATE